MTETVASPSYAPEERLIGGWRGVLMSRQAGLRAGRHVWDWCLSPKHAQADCLAKPFSLHSGMLQQRPTRAGTPGCADVSGHSCFFFIKNIMDHVCSYLCILEHGAAGCADEGMKLEAAGLLITYILHARLKQ